MPAASSPHRPGRYPILDGMYRAGGPITRDRYLQLDWAGEVPEKLDPEYEMSMPPEFRSPEYREGRE